MSSADNKTTAADKNASDGGKVVDKNDGVQQWLERYRAGELSGLAKPKIADNNKKSSAEIISTNKNSAGDKHVQPPWRPHMPKHKPEKRRKHNKATHVKKTIGIKPRTSNQMKRMFNPKVGPQRSSESTSSSYYTSSDDS